MLVNGTVFPVANVEARRYRIRLLNACQARFLNLQLYVADARPDGITYNIPKPFLYRWFMVPEDNGRLDELRQYLRDLRDGNRFRLLVSHDQRALESSEVPEWTKKRFAQVGPGTDENQRSQTVKFSASTCSARASP